MGKKNNLSSFFLKFSWNFREILREFFRELEILPMTNELLTKASKSIVKPSLSSGKMFIVNSWLGILRLSWIMASWRICCILFQIIRAKSSHHFWMVSKLLWNGAPFPESCCSRFQRFNSWSKIRNWSSFNCLITSRWWFAKLDVWSFKLLNWKRRKKVYFFQIHLQFIMKSWKSSYKFWKH